jgi:hypothetical protein
MKSIANKLTWATLALSGALGSFGLAGCNTEAFCFDRCNGESGSGTESGGSGGAGTGGDISVGSGTGGDIFNPATSGVGGGMCIPNGLEICDGQDNDCNGKVDDSPDIDLKSEKTCGTCVNNCFKVALNCKVDQIHCEESPNPGVEPGHCRCDGCAEEYYDLDGDDKCEYFCPGTATDDTVCNNQDDDCDGLKDENVNKCSDTTNCGACGNTCVVLHGTPACVNDGSLPCDSSNTQCKIQQCDCTGPDNCWKDLDKSYATGCEYKCAETNGGKEICGDGIDNDCDGKIDGADDDLSGDPLVGVACYGGQQGECKTMAHEGKTICQGGSIVCAGMNLLFENQQLEICDGKDNDCDGAIDDSPTDIGDSCGQSNIAPCAFGVTQCQNGAITCAGAVNPQPEICNGQDDDCDGMPDDMTTDSGTPCGQTDVGACQLGVIQCNGGVLTCIGAIDAQPETCNGQDDNCNGMVDENTPGTGVACGQSNTAPCAFGTTQCQGGAITCVGAVNPQAETCDGIDNDCDGAIDDSPSGTGASCGQSNTFPCSFGTILCQGGALACVGAVNPQAETCDGVDNDCDGAIDDSPSGTGGPCGSTDVGECSLGTLQCQGGAITCVGAVEAQPETCNGKDDDCDGAIDESPSGVGASCGQSNVAPCAFGTTQCVGGAITCVGAINPQSETCNTVDDDCNGVVDDNTPGSGVTCGTSNTFPCSFGTVLCQAGVLSCVGAVNPQPETCNGQDDNCNGAIDDAPSGVGGTCGTSNVGACKLGTLQCQGGSITCVGAVNPQAESCNGIDDDCDGVIDDSPSGVGGSCGASGTLPCKLGTLQCVSGAISCVGAINPQAETCNSKDDDCNGAVDDNLTDTGASCGQSSQFPCSLGSMQCQNGALSCVGAVNPQTETCNGVDDNCDGQIDKTGANPPADSVGPCNVPPPPPAGATSPCVAGAKACVGGTVACQGFVGPTGLTDTCGVDANCDGVLNNQPDKQTDTANCGACGNNCYAGAVHSIWTCAAGTCQYQGCENGYYDLNNDKKCEYACTYIQAQETCNGQDDNCNGQVDEGVIAPSPVQICGVSPSATTPECKSTSQGGLVNVACVAGAWQCTFPAGVCSPTCVAGQATPCCANTAEKCDVVDNDCDGQTNENVANFGKACASDDGLPPPGHGACRKTGTIACVNQDMAACSATKENCANLPGGCTEQCNGIDDDCDGSIDELKGSPGSTAAFYVKPTVTKISNAPNTWIYTYEASRPNATNVSPGSGNGYHAFAPAGQTLDKTLACSSPNKIPWFNVTPDEVEQTCAAMGGRVCNTAPEWTAACQATSSCTWGYNPRGAACTSTFVGTNTSNGTKYCNLGPSFDLDGNAANGDQDGLLPTASSPFPIMTPTVNQTAQCWADWSGLQGNADPATRLYDITGNLREVTRCQLDRAVCGATGDTAKCAQNCCSGTSTSVSQSVRICGAVSDNRRLSNQVCTAAGDCCDTNESCTANGTCSGGYCRNTGSAITCRARGVTCTASNQCCDGETCSGGVCGGAQAIPYSVFPLMGGSFSTIDPTGATCSFSFFSVNQSFKLYDAGFRCCFSTDPT